jgi:xylan 1,4-beta-xylosidase
VQMDIGHQLRATESGMKVVASYPEWKKTPIILGESDPEGCAACKGPQNGYRNGPLYGVSVAEAIARQNELAAKYGVMLEGAVTWALEFENQPLFAGFRELATSGKADGKSCLVDKPVLNVFRMMGMLEGDYVAASSSGALPLEDVVSGSVRGVSDVDVVATKSDHHVRVLMWNYHDDDVAAEAAQVKIVVKGIPLRERLTMRAFLMDAQHSNAYAEWQKMRSPAQPTAKQFLRLQSVGHLQSHVPVGTITADRDVEFSIKLERQAVELIDLSW